MLDGRLLIALNEGERHPETIRRLDSPEETQDDDADRQGKERQAVAHRVAHLDGVEEALLHRKQTVGAEAKPRRKPRLLPPSLLASSSSTTVSLGS